MKKLFSLLVFALMSVASFADGWVKPEVPTTGQPLTDGMECYILNVESGTFYTGAKVWHSWSTSAAVAAEGQLSKLSKSGSNWLILRASDSKHSFVSGVLGADYGSAEGRWEMHVDMGSQGHDLWEILEHNGDYRFRIAAEDEVYGADGTSLPDGVDWATLFMGHWVGEDGLYTNAVYANVTEAEGGIDWRFISAEDYDSYFEKIAVYQAAMDLKAAIEKAEADYPGIDLSAQKAVFNNTESTVEELKEALESVQAAIQAYINQKMQENASPTEPYDATGLIVNPSFEEGNTNGWTVQSSDDTGAKENANATYHCDNADGNYLFNIWAWGYPITQKIANIPNGIYRVSALLSSSDDCTNVYLTAESKIGKLHKAVTLEENPNDGRKQTWMTYGEMLMAVTNDTITIGAVGCDPDGVSYIENGKWWYKADNFRLEYLGNKLESWKFFQDNSDLGLQPYDPATTVAHKQLVADYNQALADFSSKTDPADIAYALEGVIVLSDSIHKSIAAYESLQAEYNAILESFAKVTGTNDLFQAWQAYIQNTQEAKCAELAEKVNTLGKYNFSTAYTPLVLLNPEAGVGCTLPAPEVRAYVTELGAANTSITMGVKGEGDDCTDMLVNPSFKDGFTGWTRPLNNGGVGGLDIYPVVEVWNAKVDIYQEVQNVPNGLYELNCYAFERPTAGAYSGDGTEDPKVSLYMNDFKTGVMLITADALPIDQADPGVNCAPNAEWPEGSKVIAGGEADSQWTDSEGNEYYMPNGRAGASVAFMAGRYHQKVYGLVEDGKMKIGLTSNNQTCGWVLWTDFKLTYWGKNAEVAAAVLDNIKREANTWLSDNMDDLTDEAYDALSDAIDAAKDVQGKTGEEILAIISDLYKALDAAKGNLVLVNELRAAADELSSVYEECAETASPAAVAKAEDLMAAAEDYVGLTTEEIEQLIEDIKACIEDLRLVDPSLASDDNPMDLTSVIKNADMEQNASAAGAWSYTKNGGNGPDLGSGIDGKSCEFWNSTAANLQFKLWQTIKLNEGTYTLSVQAGNSLNGQASNDSTGRAYLFAGIINAGYPVTAADSITYINDAPVEVQEAAATEAQTYEVTFVVPAGGSHVEVGVQSIGVMEARWFVCDNFHLTYYGNQSAKEPSHGTEVVIEGVDAAPTAVAPAAIFTVSGARSNTLVKGINIIRMADGSVKKVIK